jgi:hypothetical protein
MQTQIKLQVAKETQILISNIVVPQSIILYNVKTRIIGSLEKEEPMLV